MPGRLRLTRVHDLLVASVVLVTLACGSPSTGSLSEATPLEPSPSGVTGSVGAPEPTTSEGIPDSGSQAVARGADYGASGPYEAMTTRHTVTEGARSFEVVVSSPKGALPSPVVVLASGSTQTAAFYAPYAQRLASHGITTVLRSDPGPLVQTAEVAKDVTTLVLTWMPAALGARVDLTRVGLAGHSRGGAATLLAAAQGLRGKVRAWFGLDPVDNQFLVGPGTFARSVLPSLALPTGMLGASIASNCSPAADSHPMLWPLLPVPAVLVVARGAGHMQLGDPAACTACAACTPAGTADAKSVLESAVRYVTAFFARELLGDANVGAAFEGAGSPSDASAGRVTVTTK
jgi:pimeloyl-ACP methyl ester carboxylesterase